MQLSAMSQGPTLYLARGRSRANMFIRHWSIQDGGRLAPARAAVRYRRVFFESLEGRSLLAPLVNTGTADEAVYTLPVAANTAILEDDGIPGNGISRLRSTNGTFDTTTFANPSGSLTINRGVASDTLTLNALPDFDAGL